MKWIAPPKKDDGNDTLEKRLWDAANKLRANSGLTAQQDAHFSAHSSRTRLGAGG